MKKIQAVKHADLLEVKLYKMLTSYRNSIYRVFNDTINLQQFSDAKTKEEQINEFEDKVQKEINRASAISTTVHSQLYTYYNKALDVSFKQADYAVDLQQYYWGDKTMLRFLKDNTTDYISKYGNEFSLWLKDEIRSNYLQGGSYSNLIKGIRERLPVEDRKAKTIARNETGTFIGTMNKKRADDLGIEQGEWVSVLDSRTRSSHAKANGKIFEIEDGLTVDGEKTQPSLPINCRCTLKWIIPE